MNISWIIDLLIEKIKKDKTKEFEPQPIWIDNLDELDHSEPKKEKEKKSNDIIVIDL